MSQKILVVDDDELIRTMVMHFLKHDGYHVVTAHDGPTALALYEAEQPDLVVLDIAMPAMSGLEVVQKIRELQQREKRPRTPIILLTAYARSFFMSAGSEAGADSYLTKPIAADKLLGHVHQFLDRTAGPSPEASAEVSPAAPDAS